MLRTGIFASALLLGISSLAFAQTSTTSPSTTAPSTSGSSSMGSSSSSSGGAMRSEADIKKHLEQEGYSDVQLKEDTATAQKGDYTGTAKKGGKEVNLHVDSSGKVTEK